ncbi:MAG TPA: alkaline shock response membrane anchor protein AmaP [Candidatus Limnocylindria bacterium]|nr:alkaline shock response membrane anchor protein AmaP [Candidatus Limnocylindria bacterium]
METKLSLWQRIALVFGAILMVFVGAAILIGSLQLSEIRISREGEGFFTVTRLAIAAAGALAILFGAFTLSLPRRMRASRDSYVLQKTDAGEMRISVQAIESIIRKCLGEHEEIKLQDLQVNNTRGGVVVNLKATLAENVSIPLAVAAIQKHVRKHLLATGGIDAKDVRVSVVNADSAVKESPYLIKPEEIRLTRDTAAVGAAGGPGAQAEAKEGQDEQAR